MALLELDQGRSLVWRRAHRRTRGVASQSAKNPIAVVEADVQPHITASLCYCSPEEDAEL